MNASPTAVEHTTSPGTPSATRKPALPALTGLRTLLALNIVFFHFTPPHLQLLYPIINSSYVFVGFFFLLSGFVLAYNYADRPALDKRRFYLARFARLYPVYLLSLAISFRMLQAEWHVRSAHEFWTGMMLAPFLLQGWNQSLATFWNTVAWTLSAEIFLYAAFPFLIRVPGPGAQGATERGSRPALRLAALLLATWAIGLIPHTLYLLLNPDHLPGPANRYSYGPWLRILKYTPLPYLGTFFAGILLARLHTALPLTARQRVWATGLALAALAVFFAAFVTRTPYILLHGGLLLPLFSLLILGLSGEHWVASAFSFRPLVLLGDTTFCLYLLHFNTINLIHDSHLTERLHLAPLDPWLTYAAALAVAAAATFWVERPARHWILARTQSNR
ncbi:MAG: acyltransferase [Acidobacteriota bacterium]|nr:acyltransferase [Acidobacteriota bacterium]